MKKLLLLMCALLLVVISAHAQTNQSAKPVTKPGAKPNPGPPPARPTQQALQQPRQPPVQQPAQNARANKFDQRVNNANNSLNSANNSINSAGATGSNAVNAATNAKNQFKSLSDQVNTLVRNKNAGDTASHAANTTIITLKGANYAKLKKLNDAILNCDGVKDSKIKLDSARSTITVSHKGSTSDLLKQIQTKSDMVTDDSILGLDEGKISLEIK